MKRICVYAGSNLGRDPLYQEHARLLGESLVKNGLELVYGGSQIGLMTEVADRVLELGGNVTGVMPKGLFRGEVVHRGLTELIEVNDMHERKATMSQLADGFIALPGGYGTFEELFEMICWAQIGIHQKPIGLFNIAGFYDPLLNMVAHAVRAGFVKEEHQKLFVTATEADELLKKLIRYKPIRLGSKWDSLQ